MPSALHLSASALLPLCFRSASALLPLCARYAPALLPLCTLVESSLRTLRGVNNSDASPSLDGTTAHVRRQHSTAPPTHPTFAEPEFWVIPWRVAPWCRPLCSSHSIAPTTASSPLRTDRPDHQSAAREGRQRRGQQRDHPGAPRSWLPPPLAAHPHTPSRYPLTSRYPPPLPPLR